MRSRRPARTNDLRWIRQSPRAPARGLFRCRRLDLRFSPREYRRKPTRQTSRQPDDCAACSVSERSLPVENALRGVPPWRSAVAFLRGVPPWRSSVAFRRDWNGTEAVPYRMLFARHYTSCRTRVDSFNQWAVVLILYLFHRCRLHLASFPMRLTPVHGRFRRRRYSARALARVRGCCLRSVVTPVHGRPARADKRRPVNRPDKGLEKRAPRNPT
jgi:hypothetical protein